VVETIEEFKKNIPGAKWIFYSNGTDEFSEGIDETTGKQYIKRISLVLKQTFDALSEKTLNAFVIYAKNYNVLLRVFEDSTFIWAVIEKDKFNPGMLEELKNFTLKKEITAPSVEEKETREAPASAEEKEVLTTEIKKEPAEAVLPKVSSEILKDFEKTAAGYLGDFTADIFGNVMDDLKISKDNLTKESLINLCYGLERSAGMIIGPTKARKLADELLEKIKEEE